ncbi:MAG: twin-arginine translocase TatA/TatE family subunit [Dehalococcoidales bacterium]|nr:twin-arginine translocase TatA/TatE family subunit [Dehalococcoidales bacterium]
MPRIGIPELLLILVIVLIVFGAGKLPQIGGAVGKSLREFRKASRGDADEKPKSEDEKAASSTAEQSKK